MKTIILVVVVVVVFALVILYMQKKPRSTGTGGNDLDHLTPPDIEDNGIKPTKPETLK